ncbi:hypothetical protein HAX54_025529 [Datura stramonium]|uniref:Uncharacterized protein n=1 Tax=Datura stramonium TaxID=4076 RepID=A0ABS8RK35_DATST|nr:hypothetical protein [Datura stramonium]
MEDVEIEPEEKISETTYANGDHYEESIEEDAVEFEVFDQSSAILKAIPSLEKTLKADAEEKYQMDVEVDQEDLISYGEIDNTIFGSFKAAKQFIEQLKRESGDGSKASQEIDDQIIIDSNKEADTDEILLCYGVALEGASSKILNLRAPNLCITVRKSLDTWGRYL